MSIRETIRYGASELKAAYNRNLGIALGISVAFHLVLIFLYIFSRNIGKADSQGKTAPIAKIKLTNLAPPPPPQDATPPPPPPMVPPEMQNLQAVGGTGLAVRAGTPVAVPDASINPDLDPFADTKKMAFSGSEGGNGNLPPLDPNAMNNQGSGDPPKDYKDFDKEEKLPDENEFVDAQQQPTYNEEDLKRRVKYPEIARRNGIEGNIVVRALVDKKGKVVRTIIDQGGNEALETAAKEAVEGIVFTPALQNNNPVAIWIQIPVTFSLDQQ